MEYHQIFPTVIGQTSFNITNEKISKEVDFLLECELENHNDYDIVISKDKNLLKKCPNLKSEILGWVHNYAKDALNLDKKIKITQSWVTKHSSTSQLFPHRHQNSIISGSFYLNTIENQSGITFYKDNDQREKYIDWFDTNITNQYTYTNITFPCSSGKLILFPSYIKHSVTQNERNNNRLSLAFNTWFDEPIGMWENLNYLDVQ